MKGISEVSAATTISFGKNPALIADAVASAKALGMELDQVEAIADSLLDFESSIAAEMEAELLTGSEVNNIDTMRRAADVILEMGSKAVLLKGGHLKGDTLTDILVTKDSEKIYSGPRYLISINWAIQLMVIK